MIVVTNNPLVKDDENVLFVEGGFRDVLVAVRDKVYSGYELVTHPLFASSRMMFSPFRTVVLGKKQEYPSEFECQTIEDAIISYDKITARRNAQPEHDGDYATMDRRLYMAGLKEIGLLYDAHAI